MVDSKEKEALDRFGRFLMGNLRDKCIAHFDELGAWKGQAPREALVGSSDSAIHDFLFAIGENADFEEDIRVVVQGRDIQSVSDGLHGEPFGDQGWIARFSEYEP